MFERFTERARQVVVLAQDEARSLGHDYIGTEHLLLGMLREGEGLGARALESLGLNVDDTRAQVVRIVGEGDDFPTGQIPFTPHAKEVLALALREALSLGHNFIGTEHVLLGLLREGKGVGAQVLHGLGLDADRVRTVVIGMLSGPVQLEWADETILTDYRPPLWSGDASTQVVSGAGLRPAVPSEPMLLRGILIGWALGGGTLGGGLLLGWLIWG